MTTSTRLSHLKLYLSAFFFAAGNSCRNCWELFYYIILISFLLLCDVNEALCWVKEKMGGILISADFNRLKRFKKYLLAFPPRITDPVLTAAEANLAYTQFLASP